MRPVIRGAQPVPPTVPSYNPPTTLAFSAATVVNLVGSKPTLAQVLDVWLYVVQADDGEVPKKANHTTYDAATTTIKSRVGDIYKMASVPLTQHLGEFCSYCETPLPGLLEVEHSVPKAQYPTFSCTWDNFLLSCNPCNGATGKGDKPTRATARGWLATKGVTSPTEAQLYDEIRNNRYLWPDLYAETYREMPNVLFWYDATNQQWNPLATTTAEACDFNHTLVSFDISTRRVTASLYHLPGHANPATVPVFVFVDASQPRAIEMRDMVSLNFEGNTDSTYDRRTMNRTRAWFTALQSMKIAAMMTTQTQFDAYWPALLMTARVTGFYSVWVPILSQYVDPAGTNLGTRFAADTNTQIYFPNTNTAQVP